MSCGRFAPSASDSASARRRRRGPRASSGCRRTARCLSRPGDPRSRQGRGARARALGLLALAVLAAPAAASAQQRSIRFDHITIDHGLTQNTVTCILQDRIGFMWFGTQDGLNRFDGNSFVAFKHDPAYPATLPNDYVQALAEDASGDIWVGTRGGGLSRWHRTTDAFTHYRHAEDDPASLSGDLVAALFRDRDGSLWVGTERSGLNRLDPESGAFERFRHDPADPASLGDDQVRAILRDREGRLWVATLGGLNRLDDPAGGFRRFPHDPGDPATPSHQSVLAILEEERGQLWFGTFGGLDRFDRDSETFERFRHHPERPESLSPGRVRVLYEDREGRLWVGTDGGLDLYQPATRSFVHYRYSPEDVSSLSGDRIISISQDRAGVLWVGTQRGVNKWNPMTWTFSPYKAGPAQSSGFASNDVLSLSQDARGTVWIGTGGGGIHRLDRATGAVEPFRHDPRDPTSLSGDRVTALYHDREGVLWAGTLAAGLNRFDERTRTFERFAHEPERADSLGANGVATIYGDRAGRLWIGTFGGGLNRLVNRAGASFERLVHDPEDPASLSNDRVTALAEDADGALWAGTFEGGLNRLDPAARTFRRYRHDPADPTSLSSNMVFSLHVDAAGTLWVGTQIGLNRMLSPGDGETPGFRTFLERDGLPNDVVYGIHSDTEGRLWLSTNRGLSRFDPRSETFKNYDVSHGLQSDEFHMGAHHKSPAGELFFGGIEGFNAFFPDRVESNTSIPPVVLTAFSKLNRPVDPGEPIFDVRHLSIDHRDSIISFEFAALDYTAPDRNRYRYRLEGFSDEWIELGNRRRVSFTNLDPGRYTLRVLGSNNDGVWNEEGLAIALDVRAPPWRTWWAWGLYVLAAVTAVASFVGVQHRKVERERAQVRERERLIGERERLIAELEGKNAELERFNYTVSHDLKSPLVTIKGFLGLLRKDACDGDEERVEHDIRRISIAADRMYRLLEELLELSRVGRVVQPWEDLSLGELAREAVELVDGLIAGRRVEVEIAPDLPVVAGDRGRLLEVFQNLLANAVNYMGDQARPRIEIGFDPGLGAVFVHDNGIGIDPEYHERIFGLFERLDVGQEGTGVGLALVRRIVDLHGGRVWVASAGRGHGSTFYFTLRGA